MNSNRYTYRMHLLMNNTHLDALSAQKEAGSRSAYFNSLSDFVSTVPRLLDDVRAPDNPDSLIAYMQSIDQLKTKLVSVGASALVPELDRAASLAKNFQKKECENQNCTIISRMRTLCYQIEEARFSDDDQTNESEPETKDNVAASRSEQNVGNSGHAHTSGAVRTEITANAGNSSRAEDTAKTEPYKKLSQLIGDFEIDDANQTLSSLMSVNTDASIGTLLDAVKTQLDNFDYYAAIEKINDIINFINNGCKELPPAIKRKILAIDDMPDVLNTIKSVLKDKYNVYCVTNHVAALKFLRANSADLILLDIEMPEMDGFSLLSEIRKIEAYNKTPVLFLTGNVSVDNVRKSINSGGNDFIRKPVDVSILLDKIKKHIG